MLLKNRLKTIVNECINDIINEQRENHIRNIVKENIKKYITKTINEEEESNKTNNKRLDLKRNAVMGMLKNDIYDHAPLAYKLYDANDESEKATARSLFSKKATGTPDADGQVRHFDDEEVNKLYDLLRQKK